VESAQIHSWPPDKSAASNGPVPLTVWDRFLRKSWNCVFFLLFRFSPPPLHGWRRLLLRAFGAKIGRGARIYPTVRVWAPWNLVLGSEAALGYRVNCYNCATITIGDYALVSQDTTLCAATHDYRSRSFPLVTRPITIESQAWVCAEAFIGPGVKIGEGAVVGARSCVLADVNPWTVVVGNPAKFLKKRTME